MPEVEFTLNTETGQLEMHIQGFAGPSCDTIAKLARELLGAPALESPTAAYYLRPAIQTRPRSGGRP